VSELWKQKHSGISRPPISIAESAREYNLIGSRRAYAVIHRADVDWLIRGGCRCGDGPFRLWRRRGRMYEVGPVSEYWLSQHRRNP
jgi:hypothetical protein